MRGGRNVKLIANVKQHTEIFPSACLCLCVFGVLTVCCCVCELTSMLPISNIVRIANICLLKKRTTQCDECDLLPWH